MKKSANVDKKKTNKPNPNYTYLKEKIPEQRVTLLQGGTRSGKTFSTIYALIDLCLNHSGIEIDIVRDTFTALKATVWKDFKDMLIKTRLYNSDNHNKTDKIYNLNGNTINYYGADNPEKIHGRSRDLLWVNEAHIFDKETIDQLFPRTRYRVICDYNPALGLEHWLDPYIEQYPPLMTTYRDNPFLTKEQVADIESRKNDPYWWSVYGKGERAVREGVIYENWSVGEFDNSLPFIYGMDFGYVTDPTTLIRVAIDSSKKIVYAEELIYEIGLTTSDIVERLEVVDKKALIIADSAEPRLIDEIGMKGFNIYSCIKGPDSVRLGISKVQEYKIIITKESFNLKKEISNYVWNDKKSNVPVDRDNHLLDALRYAVMDLTSQQPFFFK